MNLCRISLGIVAISLALSCSFGKAEETKPNIVIILADDLGYGDVQAYNPDRGKIATPNIDKLAAAGMRFTDAHSSCGVCSPSRYALLTGRYHWRTRLQQGIVGVWTKPLIAPDRATIATLAKKHGYYTACVGKWHLGWDWPVTEPQLEKLRALANDPEKGKGFELSAEVLNEWAELFGKRIPGGPTERGFDYYFGTDVPNWPPFCFIENDRTVGIPTEILSSTNFGNNRASLQGPALKDWSLEKVLPTLAEKACAIIEEKSRQNEPYLLYLPLTSPHTPLAPNQEWKGKSGINAYADLVMETDAVVGKVLATIDANKGSRETLIIFTSDNGCAPYIGIDQLKAKGHFSSGPLRGFKADAWEGGHRVPFIAKWKGRIEAGSKCDATICSVDIYATLAEFLHEPIVEKDAEDSVSLLPLLEQKVSKIHEHVVHQSSTGIFALRSGDWKAIFGPGSGASKRPANERELHLFNIAEDLGEQNDLASSNPAKAAEMVATIQHLVESGRSTPGANQKNDVSVRIWKGGQAQGVQVKGTPTKTAQAKATPETSVMPMAKADSADIAKDSVVFRKIGDVELKLHYFESKQNANAQGRPAILFFFGGGWSSWNIEQFTPFAEHFAREGMVAITAEYRVASKHKTTPIDAVEDAREAIRFIRANAKARGIDPQKIVASGGSAGGHLAAVLATIPTGKDEGEELAKLTEPNALILFNPVLDTSRSGFRGKESQGKWDSISPLQHVSPGRPPMLIFHGTADKTVPIEQIEKFVAAMQDSGNSCELVKFADRGHGFFNPPKQGQTKSANDYQKCLDEATRFLRERGFLPGG